MSTHRVDWPETLSPRLHKLLVTEANDERQTNRRLGETKVTTGELGMRPGR